MSRARIRRRQHPPSKRHPKGHTTYMVVYRRGGRFFPVETAGTFEFQKDAAKRRDMVNGWLAVGKNPKDELAAMQTAPPKRRTLTDWGQAWLKSRLDVSDKTDTVYRAAVKKLDDLADRDLWDVTTADLQMWVSDHGKLAPSTLQTYMTAYKLIFDFAEREPNPVRRVKLPRIEREETQPPTAAELELILPLVARPVRLVVVVLEQTAMRIGETVALEWRDVDAAGCRFRLRAEIVKGRRGRRRPRWVQLPDWLMGHVLDTCPLEDRAPERRVFQGVTEDKVRSALERACRAAGTVVYTPHDLRHRRASLWHGQGVTVRELMERGGWSRSAVPLETYSHVMPLDEVPVGVMREVLG